MAGGPSATEGRTIDVLRRQLAEARAERDAAQAEQAALAEVLRAINASPGNLKPVFDLLVDKAIALCGAAGGELVTFEDDVATAASLRNVRPGLAEFWKTPQRIAGTSLELVRRGGKTVHRPDMSELEGYRQRLPLPVAGVELGGIRTFLQVPLKNDRGVLGLFMIFRHEVQPFTDKQVALVEAFANQAALAMENARLLTKQREALEQQTATTELLEVINASPGDLAPVFDAMLEKAMRLCEADFGVFGRFDGKVFETVAGRGVPDALVEATRRIESFPADSGLGRMAAGEQVVQLVDLADTELYRSGYRGATALVDLGGARTAIFVALRRDDALLGTIVMYRREVRAYSDKQVALLQNFAAQAVIAMENARLLTEQREGLEQQTATAEVLKVISESPTDVQPVLDAVTAAAIRFCGAEDVTVTLRDGDELEMVAHQGPLRTAIGLRDRVDRTSIRGRSIVDGATIHVPDIAALDPAEYSLAVQQGQQYGFRSNLTAPMLREGTAIGCLTLRRAEPGAFTQRQIQLLETFAAQAVIAIENVRLFTELRESLDQQTATADILRVISQSPTDVAPVLDVVVKAAQRFCGADDVVISLRDGDELAIAAHDGPIPPPPPRRRLDRSTAQGRAVIDAATVHIPDIGRVDPAEWASLIELSARLGGKASLAAPMLREGLAVGAIMLRRREVGAFTERQIALLEAFAAQAVIAIENVRLFTELRESLDQQTATADILRVISQSPTDVAPVLDAVAKAALRFCGAEDIVITLREGERWLIAAHDGPMPAPVGTLQPLNRQTSPGWAMLDAKTIHLPDIPSLDPVEYAAAHEFSRSLGFKAAVAAPMLREGTAVGAIALRRAETGAFTPRQIELLESFAAQAVIALENTRLFTELRESLDQQTATTEILQTINGSPGDLQPVFDTIVDKARTLCNAAFGMFNTFDGQRFHTVATRGVPDAFAQYRLSNPPDYGPNTAPGRLIAGEDCVHTDDMADSDVYRSGEPNRRAMVDLGGARSALIVALRKERVLLGMIAIYRQEVRPFSGKEIALLQSFAAQAVIAMENARLLTELRESLDYQTATSEVLAVISRSPADLQPVLEAMTAAAVRLCGVKTGGLSVRRGDSLQFVALVGQTPEFERWQMSAPIPIERGIPLGDAILDRKPVQIVDVMETEAYKAGAEVERAVVDLGLHRTVLHVPLLRDDEAVGVLTVSRSEPEAFTERQIGLIETFADQAVIAMENARLLSELRQRTDDLTESLEYQTATSEVLEVISRSAFDLKAVLHTLVETATRLCEADKATITRLRDGVFYREESYGFSPEFADYVRELPIRPGRDTGTARALLERRTIHIADVEADPDFAFEEGRRLDPFRTVLAVPMLRDGMAIGAIALTRSEVRPFSDKQVGMLSTFADQAVIALENARLLGDLRQRTDDLTESLEYQTATSEVLEVIGRSTSDIQPVLDTMLSAALRLCRTESGGIAVQQGDAFRYVATLGWDPEADEAFRSLDITAGRGTVAARVLAEGRIVHVADVASDPEFALPDMAERAQWHTALGVPLLRDDRPIGIIAITRNRVEPFTERQIALVKTFADQAVIAMENARLLGELRESLDQQTATAEILRVINSSPGDLAPVFQAILEKAHSTCGADMGTLFAWDGTHARAVATLGYDAEIDQILREPHRPIAPMVALMSGQRFFHRVHERDRTGDGPHEFGPRFLAGSQIRTNLIIPLRKDDTVLGFISANRREVRPYSDKEIALLESFAAQAVIAMENARLLGELRESLDQQTATSDVLRTISRSSVDLEAVLDTLVETVARLCHADQAYLFRRQDDLLHMLASFGAPDEARQWIVDHPFEVNDTSLTGRVARLQKLVHIPDVLADPVYAYAGRQIAGFRTLLGIPLLREDSLLGVFAVARTKVEPFTEKEIALASGFADQAVIAIENARLFEELRDRQAELRVTFDNMGDGVVMFDADLRLAAWNRNFQELLDVPDDFLTSRPGLEHYVRLLVQRGELGDRDPDKEVARYRDRATRQWSAERTRPDGRVLEVRNNPVPGGGAVLIYSDITKRKQAEAEIRAARDAAEAALERQTATADILKVIANSPTDVQPVLDVVAKAAVRFCGATDAVIHMRDGNDSISAAHEGPMAAAPGRRMPLSRETGYGAAILDCRTIHRPDIRDLDPVEFAAAHKFAAEFGFRAVLVVPLLREGTSIGSISLRRIEPGAFTQQQIELLETFAAQAVIAVENVRLFTELRDSLDRLKAAQANLVQSEKMASLGQLTAGIAHEIKNPLNFVNNFAGLSVELLDELKEVAGPGLDTLDEDKRAELDETMQLLVGNLQKIAEHGKRADGIVKSMLSHSRGGSGDWAPSDINALVEEALNLAYHGARAQDKEFNVTLERDFTKESKPIEVVPQDVTRVFLNLFGNGFYAANKRRTAAKQGGFRPTIKVSTRDLGDAVEVRVRDNGIGIPPEVREKLFQPFFTTKPTGEGTGLGLSISYDIVTQQHGGTIEVESEPGNFTEFTVRLPRSRRVQQGERA